MAASSPDPVCWPAVGVPKPLVRIDGRNINRLAILGGSYGNVPALESCLRHAAKAGCDGFAFLGDATGFCGHSDETIQLIRQHCSILVAGNYEQKAAAGQEDCGCNYADDEDNYYGSLAHQWAMRTLSDANRAWISTWPDLALLETTFGTILLSHGSPARTNEFLYESQTEDETLEGWLDQFGAIGLLCTHSGLPWIRPLSERRFAANCGVCGKPDHDGDPAVHYATLDLRAGAAPAVEIARVEYDYVRWADQLAQEGVHEIFTTSLRTGAWTCGLRSLPLEERARGMARDLASAL